MITNLPIGTYIKHRVRGQTEYGVVTKIPESHLKQYPPNDPNDIYGFQFIRKDEIPPSAKIIDCIWKGDTLLPRNKS